MNSRESERSSSFAPTDRKGQNGPSIPGRPALVRQGVSPSAGRKGTSITVEIVSPGPSRATIEARPERAADRAPAHGRTSLPREGPLGAAGAGRAAPDG